MDLRVGPRHIRDHDGGVLKSGFVGTGIEGTVAARRIEGEERDGLFPEAHP